jgi:hypothetical protein
MSQRILERQVQRSVILQLGRQLQRVAECAPHAERGQDEGDEAPCL